MITSLHLKDFKNFADEKLRIGPFTVIVGTNASGKSNIRDAFRFLHGIGRGYTLAEIVGGKYGADWKPIRGSAGGIVRFGTRKSTEDFSPFALEVGMRLDLSGGGTSHGGATYRIEACPQTFGGGGLSVVSERLSIGGEEVYSEGVFDDRPMEFARTQPGPCPSSCIGHSTLQRTRR